MPWFSILPPYLSFVEVWAARVFFVLAMITIGPWLLFLLYDILLYLWRSATYELPYLGGRARGRQRPRAPSLVERPNGHTRGFSLPGTISSGFTVTETNDATKRGSEDDVDGSDPHDGAIAQEK
ncbi:MAG: hypothetical protein M1815_003452 [Lichina confinis]|nr:MAG: hypothetical protein M1815_003452 [Lichina confinis]